MSIWDQLEGLLNPLVSVFTVSLRRHSRRTKRNGAWALAIIGVCGVAVCLVLLLVFVGWLNE